MLNGNSNQSKKEIVDQIKGKIDSANKIVISSHRRPDADSIGSGLALFLMLQQLKKSVFYYNTDKAPFPLTELPGYEAIKFKQVYPEKFDLFILIEGGTESRTGQKHIDQYESINIDHHATSVYDSDINWVEPNASSVGELIYELGIELGIKFTKEIGFNLYAAISSDTGSFKYSNTTGKSLKIASEIIKKSGIEPEDVTDLLYNSNSVEKVKLIQRILETLELHLDNRVSTIVLKQSFLDNMSLRDIETEDIIAIARSIYGLQVTLFFKEIKCNCYRVSIRAKGEFDSLKIAQLYGGGGHNHAAGFFYEGSLSNALDEILKIIEKQLNSLK